MTLFVSVVVAVLFGVGATLLLKPDLFRVVAGVVLVSNAASLTVLASALQRGQAPILPFVEGEPVADPLTQAMTLTALVIGFATAALLLALVYRVYRTHSSVDLDDLSRSERADEERIERGAAVEVFEPLQDEPGDPDEREPDERDAGGRDAHGASAQGAPGPARTPGRRDVP